LAFVAAIYIDASEIMIDVANINLD